MNNCEEFVLDDVMAITAIPISDFIPGLSSWQLTPTIPSTSFSPTLSHSITIGLHPAISGGTLIPIIRKTGKAKDSEDDSVAGRKHSLTVNCEIDDRDSEVWNHLLTLERTPSHLLLTFRNGERAFVSATQDSYLCNVSRDGATTSVKFRIECYLGLQLLT